MTVRAELERQLRGLPGLDRRESRWGNGSAYYVGDREIAHFHGDERMDVRLTSGVVRELRAAGALDPRVRTRGPTAQWVSVRVEASSDVAPAVELVETAIRAHG